MSNIVFVKSGLLVFLFIFLSALCSCSPKKCKKFDYQKFGLDTAEFTESIEYTSSDISEDTMHLEHKRVHFILQEEEVKSFAAYMECTNGIAGDIFVENQVVYQYYLVRKDSGYTFGLFSGCIEVHKLEKLENISDIDLSVNNRKSKCFIDSLVIEDGIMTSFVDSSGVPWNATKYID